MFAYCLADFFNLRLLPNGRPPNAADIRDGIHELVGASITALRAQKLYPRELTVRLYGGWFLEGTGATPLRDLVARVASDYPRRQGCRLRVTIAEGSVIQPHLRFFDTLRPSPAKLRPLPVAHSICSRGAGCSQPILLQWMAGKCPTDGCPTRLDEVVLYQQQKTVDTLLTADALHLGHRGAADAIVVASDDDDFLPAILGARAVGLPVISLMRRDPAKVRYRSYLEGEGIGIAHW